MASKVTLLIEAKNRAKAVLRRVTKQVRGFGDDSRRGLRGLRSGVASLRNAFLGLAGAIGALRAGRFIFKTNVDLQKLEATLKTVTGSTEAAARAMELITEFAKLTPFEIQNLTRSFVDLQARGLAPTREDLSGLGNFAAAFTKDITELTDAIISLSAGMVRPIRRFGIDASVQGERVKLTFRGITREIDRSATGIARALAEIGATEFPEAMAERMSKLDGAIANLKDSSALLAREIGRQGLNAAIVDLVREIDTAIQESDEFAEVLGETLASGVRGLTDAFRVLQRHLDTIILAVQVLTGAAIGRALASTVAKISAAAVAAGGLRAAIIGFAGGPVTAVVTLAGAILVPLIAHLTKAKDEARDLAREIEGLGEAQLGALEKQRAAIDAQAEPLRQNLSRLREELRELEDAGAPERILAGKRSAVRIAQEQVSGLNDQLRILDAKIREINEDLAITVSVEAETDGGPGEPGIMEQIAEDLAEDLEKRVRDRLRQLVIEMRQIRRGFRLPRPSELAPRPALPTERLAEEPDVQLLPSTEELAAGASDALVPIIELESAWQRVGREIGEAIKFQTDFGQVMADITTGVLFDFTNAFQQATAAAVSGSESMGEAFKDAMLGAVASIASGLAKFYAAKAVAAIGEGLLGHPGAFAAAAKFTAASAAFGALAGALQGLAAGGGAAARAGFETRGAELEGGADRGEATIVIEGGFLNMHDPRQADSFRDAMEELTGRRVTIIQTRDR